MRLARWAAASGVSPVARISQAAEDLRMPEEQVQLQWDRARLAGLIELHEETARAGWRLRAWDRDKSAVLRGWVALVDAWSLVCPPPLDADSALVADVVVAAPQLLSVMHLSSGPVTEATLLELLTQRIAELRDERAEHANLDAVDTPTSGELGRMLDWALDGLASVGALTRCHDPGEDGQAVLTPLGNWAVWVKLEQICVAALSPVGNIEQSADAMLRGCARLTPGPARDEYRAWLAARPTGPAVSELLDAARGYDALVRALAFEALRVVGAPAEPSVREVAANEPALRPYALLWLAEHEGADPEDLANGAPGVLTRDEATWLWVDTAAAVADHGESQLLVDHLASAAQASVPDLLEEVRASGHPRTVQVLVALAAAHPDPALARAVRRAAFQVHTGGA